MTIEEFKLELMLTFPGLDLKALAPKEQVLSRGKQAWSAHIKLPPGVEPHFLVAVTWRSGDGWSVEGHSFRADIKDAKKLALARVEHDITTLKTRKRALELLSGA
jgi:hypothetical protein